MEEHLHDSEEEDIDPFFINYGQKVKLADYG